MATSASTASLPTPESVSDFDPSQVYRLSRYTHLRPSEESGVLLAENLRTGRCISLTHSTQISLVLHFLSGARAAELTEGLDDARRSAVTRFLATCHGSGLLTAVDADGRGEDEQEVTAHWEPHDLLFHIRSRRGRTPSPVGATYSLSETLAPVPAISEPAQSVMLKLPTGEGSTRSTRSLTDVLESRRSLYRTTPVSLEALGELLYRSARITGQKKTEDGEVLLQKVYPSGGSLHSLELYVIPARCPGLSLGVYQYRADKHALARVAGPGPDVDGLLEEARWGTGRMKEVPSVLLIFTARFRRVARKYSGLSYGLILKEVGAAFQTLYLVATDMGLAPCALGAGDSDGFARAAGKDYFHETSVGELVLGGPAA